MKPAKPRPRAAATSARTRRAARRAPARARSPPRPRARSASPAPRGRRPARPSRSHVAPSPGAGKPSSISSHSVRWRAAASPRTRRGRSPRRCAKTASSVGSQPSRAARSRIARRYVTPVATCGHWRGSSLSENRPRNSSSVRGGATIPCAWWSTSATSLSTSGSVPAARMPRPRRSRSPTRSGGRRGRSPRGPGPSAPVSTASAASASSASSCVAGSRRIPSAARSSSPQRGRVHLDRRRAARARAPGRPGRPRSGRRARGTGCGRVRRLELEVGRRLLHARGTATAPAAAPRGCRGPSSVNAPAQCCGTMRR